MEFIKDTVIMDRNAYDLLSEQGNTIKTLHDRIDNLTRINVDLTNTIQEDESYTIIRLSLKVLGENIYGDDIYRDRPYPITEGIVLLSVKETEELLLKMLNEKEDDLNKRNDITLNKLNNMLEWSCKKFRKWKKDNS